MKKIIFDKMKTFLKTKILVVTALLFAVSTNVSAQFSGGNGTEDNPYLITTPAELAQLATLVNEGAERYSDEGVHYKLGNDIDLYDYGENFNDGKGWIPIGRAGHEIDDDGNYILFHPFKGVFDGDNYKVTNLRINIINLDNNNSKNIHIGLFGYIDNGAIKNLGIVDVNISSPVIPVGFSIYAGAIVGLNNSNISNCYSTGIVSASTDFFNASTTREALNEGLFGGIVGTNRGNVSNCYSLCSILNGLEGPSTGGIAGNNIGIISNCYSTGDVYSVYGYDAFSGGITGMNSGNVFNCYSTGSVSAKGLYTYAGGVVGRSNAGVSNCYSTGLVTSSGSWYSHSFAGGVVGIGGGVVSDCVALNPKIYCYDYGNFIGRVVSDNSLTLVNNIAFNNMLNFFDTPVWNNKGLDQIDGEDIFAYKIWADGSLGGRFTSENGWTTENGKLPGLFGNVVDIPEHLIFTGVNNIYQFQELIAYVQNGILYISGLSAGESWCIYNTSGILIAEGKETGIMLPVKGIYIVKSGNKAVKVVF